MRKFRKALDELIAVNPEGNDFLCSPEFKKYASTLNYKYKNKKKPLAMQEVFVIDINLIRIYIQQLMQY